MPKTPSPLHTKPIPKSVSKPTETAEAAATVAESAVAPAPAAKRAAKAPAKKAAVVAKTKPAAQPAAKATPAPAKAKTKAKAAAPTPTHEPAPVAAAKPAKVHKPKLVRDSFTIPKDEYQVLDALKQRALGLEQHVRKSELLRAGIQALAAMNDKAFLKAIDAVPTLKTGRPKAD